MSLGKEATNDGFVALPLRRNMIRTALSRMLLEEEPLTLDEILSLACQYISSDTGADRPSIEDALSSLIESGQVRVEEGKFFLPKKQERMRGINSAKGGDSHVSSRIARRVVAAAA